MLNNMVAFTPFLLLGLSIICGWSECRDEEEQTSLAKVQIPERSSSANQTKERGRGKSQNGGEVCCCCGRKNLDLTMEEEEEREVSSSGKVVVGLELEQMRSN